MTYERLAKKGIDFFIKYHPRIVKLKREAKNLQKNSSEAHLNIAQCQEIIAHQYGYNNWAQFYNLIKNNYKASASFSVAQETIINGKENLAYKKEDFLLGYDINFNHYKTTNSITNHNMIFGHDIYKQYDLFLAFQAIEKGNSVIFICGEENTSNIYSLLNYANHFGEEKNICYLDFVGQNVGKYKKFERKIQQNFLMSNEEIFELLEATIFEQYKDQMFWHEKARNLAHLVVEILNHIKNKNKIDFNFETINEYIDFNKLFSFYKSPEKFSDEINLKIKNYFYCLPGFDEYRLKQKDITFEQHGFVQMLLSNILNKFSYYNYNFSNDENSFNLKHEISTNEKLILIIHLPKKNLASDDTSFLSNYILSEIQLGIRNKIKTEQTNKQSIFIRNCSIFKKFTQIGTQARALGLSMNYSYPNVEAIYELCGHITPDYLFSNTGTFFISPNEEDINTKKILNILFQEKIDGQQNSKNTNLQIFLNPQEEYLKKDFLWCINQQNHYQLQFKNIDISQCEYI